MLEEWEWLLPEVLGPLPAPWVETERGQPLVDGDRNRSDVERGEDGDPQFRREGEKEGQERDFSSLAWRRKERHPAEVERRREVYHFRSEGNKQKRK